MMTVCLRLSECYEEILKHVKMFESEPFKQLPIDVCKIGGFRCHQLSLITVMLIFTLL